MKKEILMILILVLISCSHNEPISIEAETPKHELKMFYQESTERLSKGIIFNEIETRHIVEQVSSTKEIKLLRFTAKSKHNIDNYVSFRVLDKNTGNNSLYDNHFEFRVRGHVPYIKTSNNNFNFQVITNNDIEFIANFSGVLQHWNNNTKIMQTLTINSGSISITY